MTEPAGKIFTLKTRYPTLWSAWGEKFIFWPRRSINGDYIVGAVYYREIMNAWAKVPLSKNHPDAGKQWATGKEVFIARLAGEEDE